MSATGIGLAVLIDDNDIDLFVQKRFIEISGDVLTYKNPTPATGRGTAVVTLKRATSATE